MSKFTLASFRSAAVVTIVLTLSANAIPQYGRDGAKEVTESTVNDRVLPSLPADWKFTLSTERLSKSEQSIDVRISKEECSLRFANWSPRTSGATDELRAKYEHTYSFALTETERMQLTVGVVDEMPESLFFWGRDDHFAVFDLELTSTLGTIRRTGFGGNRIPHLDEIERSISPGANWRDPPPGAKAAASAMRVYHNYGKSSALGQLRQDDQLPLIPRVIAQDGKEIDDSEFFSNSVFRKGELRLEVRAVGAVDLRRVILKGSDQSEVAAAFFARSARIVHQFRFHEPCSNKDEIETELCRVSLSVPSIYTRRKKEGIELELRNVQNGNAFVDSVSKLSDDIDAYLVKRNNMDE